MSSPEPAAALSERTPEDILRLVQAEFGKIKSHSLRSSLQKLLVIPTMHMRNWDYGQKGEQYPCWTVAMDPARDVVYVYSDFGFGPERPWGAVSKEDPWFGTRDSWSATLEEAYSTSDRTVSLHHPLGVSISVKGPKHNPKAASYLLFLAPMTILALAPLGLVLFYVFAEQTDGKPSPAWLLVNLACMVAWWVAITPLSFGIKWVTDRKLPWRWRLRWAMAACAKAAAVLLAVLCLAWGYAAFLR